MLYSKYLVNFNNLFKKKRISRAQIVTKYFLNKTLFIYNGKFFVKTKITPFRLNTKFGSYAKTRVFITHKKKIKNKSKK